MSATEIVQFRVEPSVRRDLESRCARRGVSVSQGLRDIVMVDLYGEKPPADELASIIASADEKLDASGLPEPSVDQIVEYCERVRAERSAQMLA